MFVNTLYGMKEIAEVSSKPVIAGWLAEQKAADILGSKILEKTPKYIDHHGRLKKLDYLINYKNKKWYVEVKTLGYGNSKVVTTIVDKFYFYESEFKRGTWDGRLLFVVDINNELSARTKENIEYVMEDLREAGIITLKIDELELWLK